MSDDVLLRGMQREHELSERLKKAETTIKVFHKLIEEAIEALDETHLTGHVAMLKTVLNAEKSRKSNHGMDAVVAL